MRFAILFVIIINAALTMWTSESSAQDEVYRWVDENGVVHFGDQAPQQQEAEVVSIPQTSGISIQPPSSPDSVDPAGEQEPQPSAAQQARDARAERRAEIAEREKITAEACAQRRTLVSQLEPSTRVIVKTEDGKVTRMDDNVRLETLNEAKTYIAENCDK